MPSACAQRRKAGDYRKRGPCGIARLRALAATPPQGPARRLRSALKLHGMTDTAISLREISGETVREVCRRAIAPEQQRFFPGRLMIDRAGAPGPRHRHAAPKRRIGHVRARPVRGRLCISCVRSAGALARFCSPPGLRPAGEEGGELLMVRPL